MAADSSSTIDQGHSDTSAPPTSGPPSVVDAHQEESTLKADAPTFVPSGASAFLSTQPSKSVQTASENTVLKAEAMEFNPSDAAWWPQMGWDMEGPSSTDHHEMWFNELGNRMDEGGQALDALGWNLFQEAVLARDPLADSYAQSFADVADWGREGYEFGSFGGIASPDAIKPFETKLLATQPSRHVANVMDPTSAAGAAVKHHVGNKAAGQCILDLVKPPTSHGSKTDSVVKPATKSGVKARSRRGAEAKQNASPRTALLNLCGARNDANSDQQSELGKLSRQELLNFKAVCFSERPPTPLKDLGAVAR